MAGVSFLSLVFFTLKQVVFDIAMVEAYDDDADRVSQKSVHTARCEASKGAFFARCLE